MESDIRFYRRRASEELAAANRAVTESARERRMVLAGVFLERLNALNGSEVEPALGAVHGGSAFTWASAE